jgi:hypothetical protein
MYLYDFSSSVTLDINKGMGKLTDQQFITPMLRRFRKTTNTAHSQGIVSSIGRLYAVVVSCLCQGEEVLNSPQQSLFSLYPKDWPLEASLSPRILFLYQLGLELILFRSPPSS